MVLPNPNRYTNAQIGHGAIAAAFLRAFACNGVASKFISKSDLLNSAARDRGSPGSFDDVGPGSLVASDP